MPPEPSGSTKPAKTFRGRFWDRLRCGPDASFSGRPCFNTSISCLLTKWMLIPTRIWYFTDVMLRLELNYAVRPSLSDPLISSSRTQEPRRDTYDFTDVFDEEGNLREHPIYAHGHQFQKRAVYEQIRLVHHEATEVQRQHDNNNQCDSICSVAVPGSIHCGQVSGKYSESLS